jgi:hypothetical protein
MSAFPKSELNYLIRCGEKSPIIAFTLPNLGDTMSRSRGKHEAP